MKVKMSYKDVLRRTKGFKDSAPKIFKNLIEQFNDMAAGGEGGPLFGHGYRKITVRKHYYSEWANEDFVRLLKDLGEYTK